MLIAMITLVYNQFATWVMIEVRTCTLSSVLAQSTMRKPKFELKKKLVNYEDCEVTMKFVNAFCYVKSRP